ncbi:Stk1 family PASTA domain-containing Ser/Thr kinase [Kineosporia sp. A_224]|uniref:Stk1 family PASTA domain-containing Ser/Thr kinase n=1 Tax=Kineosporia sp. A_224 TaxID=1962180 RepID=UPI000B4B7A20|nr:Stk1 family PASTA domain-containing Ser/Thr kinase [Kineosporia sp. A_224]
MNTSPRVLGNRYEVGDLLGRGGMAEVHLGRDTRLGRTVAIKLLRTDLARDATFQARFRREAQSAASLNHPAIVSVYDTGEEVVTESGGGVVPLPYIVMEYIEGRTLRDMLRGGQPLEVGLAMEITAGVLAALEYSHKAGIVHRDIKPANVMLTPRGDVKVMDFGIARALADSSATMTQTQAVIGTAQYLSPEQARGETVDARSDLYSAGCLLYELLTARPPFVADSPVAVAYQHVRELPQPPSVYNPAIPENVDRIVLHSLEKDRESRYQSAALFRADLDSARAGRPVQAYAGAGSAAAAAAATEFMPQAGTRAMTSVGTAQPGGGLLPGAPGVLQPGLPVNDPDGHWDDDEGSGGGRKAGYALLFVAVLLVFGLIAFFVAKSIGNDTPDVVQIPMPDVVNVAQADAEKQVKDAGLVPVVVTAASDTVEKGLVIKTTPAAGAQVDKGASVTLTVSAGPDVVPVPDVAGFTQSRAREAIDGAGLKVGDITFEDSPDVSKDDVIRSDPEAGFKAAPGDVVNLVISTGQVTVPDFTGKKFSEAKKALQALGLSVESSEEASDKPVGTVISQTPKDTKVDQGSTVTIVVAKAQPTPTPTPTDTATP